MITDKFENHLRFSIDWLIKSRHISGGSSAYYAPLFGWSKPYPETTGYIIPTLLEYYHYSDYKPAYETALEFGEWLLSIQSEQGYWNAGQHPPEKKDPSVFNTGQILFGLKSLLEETNDTKWAISLDKATGWLCESIDENGYWKSGHYRGFNPTYYSRVAWGILLASTVLDNKSYRKKAILVLDSLIKNKNPNGTFSGWGFDEHGPAFTHTIAYTLRGFMESSIDVDDWEKYGAKTEQALQKFYTLAELKNGRLAGQYDEEFSGTETYSCITGNFQIALCLMRWYEKNNDLRLLNASSKLIEFSIGSQSTAFSLFSHKGAIPGSKPFWGRYMMFRYPNWSAKFCADALLLFLKLYKKESDRWDIAES
ncbi:MAG: hypothetical protein U5K72_12590 [Balneolaceae bacterium]|nr:hypothetical protein [Balneolaceae bacterium]